MICQKCGKNNGEVHYKSNINGFIREMILCPECAEDIDLDGGFGFNYFNKMLSSFISPVMRSKTYRCPVCGTSEHEVLATGKAGCAECYHTFEDIFTPLIKRLNGNATHNGKTPVSAGEELATKRYLKEAKDALEKAVKAQDFEEAAVIRDKIKEIEGGTQA